MKKDILLSPSFGEYFHSVYIVTDDVTTEKRATFEQLPELLSSYPGYTIHLFGNESFLSRIEKELRSNVSNKYNTNDWKIVYNK